MANHKQIQPEEAAGSRILRELPIGSLERLLAGANRIECNSGDVLYSLNEEVNYLYFPSGSAVISLLNATEENDDPLEVAIVGAEGVAGSDAFLCPHTFHQAVVQIAGNIFRIPMKVAHDEFRLGSDFQGAMLRHLYLLLGQVSQTALCNRLHTASERLARWLLLTLDRSPSNKLPITHELIAQLLGTRRSTVTLTAGALQQAGVIRVRRGDITVLDRGGLEKLACQCYSTMQWIQREAIETCH